MEEGKYIDVNRSYTDLVGYSKEELIGSTTSDINFFLDFPDRIKFVKELSHTGTLRNYETQVFSKIKGVRTFSFSAEIIELQRKKCIIWVGYDVTDQISLEKEVLEVTGRERYRIGKYLHDDLGQHIVGVEVMCSLLEKRLRSQKNPEVQPLEEIGIYLREAHEKARSMASTLCPVRLEEHGLHSAISELVSKIEKMYGVSCRFQNLIKDIKIYNSQIAINMYYIVQEAINNALRHGEAENIDITYSSNQGKIYLSIEDDGAGFSLPESVSSGMGLNLMKYRARAIGGTLEVTSSPGSGTSVFLRFPKINNKKNEWDWK